MGNLGILFLQLKECIWLLKKIPCIKPGFPVTYNHLLTCLIFSGFWLDRRCRRELFRLWFLCSLGGEGGRVQGLVLGNLFGPRSYKQSLEQKQKIDGVFWGEDRGFSEFGRKTSQIQIGGWSTCPLHHNHLGWHFDLLEKKIPILIVKPCSGYLNITLFGIEEIDHDNTLTL